MQVMKPWTVGREASTHMAYAIQKTVRRNHMSESQESRRSFMTWGMAAAGTVHWVSGV